MRPKQTSKNANLVGKRCIINCHLNGQQTEVLWDTGAQVSIVSEHFLKQKFLGKNLPDISELIECKVNVTAANGTSIPYKGWTELQFTLAGNQKLSIILFLVTKETIDLPLVGFSGFEEFIKADMFEADLKSVFSHFPSDIISVLTDLVKRTNEAEFCCLNTGRKDHLIKTVSSIKNRKVSFRLNHGPVEIAAPVLFERDELVTLPSGTSVNDTLFTVKPGKSSKLKIEVVNNSKYDIVLPCHSVLGKVE